MDERFNHFSQRKYRDLTMWLKLTYSVAAAFLLLASIGCIALEAPMIWILNDGGFDNSSILSTDDNATTSSIMSLVIILVKGLSAIFIGLFVSYCVCARFGKCLKKRNTAILASGQNTTKVRTFFTRCS